MTTQAKVWDATRKGPGAKKCKWPQEAEKGKEMVSPLRTSRRDADPLTPSSQASDSRARR